MDIYLFSGTHWDREWYQTFQGFRFRLVKMMDGLIKGLEDNENYGVFHLDGQTIVLEDYLEVMPQNKSKLENIIKSGKLQIGPWYCMPDEFLLSGESLIKNLQKGFKEARKYGTEPLKYGYICDIFGHIAQMPQIFEGMGIRHALLGRGTNEHTTPMHFIWEGIDGTNVITFKLADQNGYGNFTSEVLQQENDTRDLPDEILKKRIKMLVDYEIKRSNIPVLMLMDAVDHTFYHPDTSRYIKIIKELYPDASVHHTNAMEMCSVLTPLADKLTIKRGELNEPAKQKAGFIHLITHTLSSRFPIKQANDRLQAKLEKWIAPLYAFNLVNLPISYLDMANKYLLQNHPHDSICGCSIDQVHKDMEYRFDQANMICGEIMDEFCYSMRGDIGENKLIKIFNPLPYKDKRVVEAAIDFETDYPEKYQEPFGYEQICSFKIFDAYGAEVPYGISNITTNKCKRIYNQNAVKVDSYKVVFEAELEATALTEYMIVPYENSSRYLERLSQTENSVENEFIKLRINQNGSINIYDKITQREYDDLLTAINDGEIGDGWYHVNPACDKIITNTAAVIEKIENNINRVMFKVTQTLRLPDGIINNSFGIKRSENYIPFEIIHFISLSKGERWVKVKTKINNNVKDHRFRIKLPTGIQSKNYYANQPFCFVERNTDIDLSTQTWKECEVLEKQMGGIVLKKDENGGFAFISESGLHECGVTGNGDMFITLFRAFSKTVMTNGETGGQLLDDLEFNYLLMPFDKNTGFADIQKRQDFIQTGEVCINTKGDKVEKHDSLLEIKSDSIIFSTGNKNEDCFEIRVYNMSEEKSSAIINLPGNITNAQAIDLDGQIQKGLKIKNNQLKIELDKWKIQTIRFY